MRFVERLNKFTTTEMQQVFRGIERRCPGRKAEMTAELNRIWLDEPQVFLDRMSRAERHMLADSVHAEREAVSPERLKARHGLDFDFRYRMGRRDESPQYIKLFVFFEFGEYLILEDVRGALRTLLPEPEVLRVQTSEPDLSDLTLFETEPAVFPELRRMLQLTAAGRLKVSEKTGQPSKAAVNAVAGALTVPEDARGPNRSFIWPILLQQCGWAKFRAGKFGLTPSGKTVLKTVSPEGFAKGVRELMRDRTFDEILRVPEIKGFRGKAARKVWHPVEYRREYIFDALREFPVNQWVSMNDAYAFLLASGGDCRVVLDGDVLYLYDREYGALYDEEWNIGKVYFRQMICESMATLGLVDLLHREKSWYRPDLNHSWGMDDVKELTRYDGIEYIRLTPLGHFCMGDGNADYKPPVAERKPLFNVLPNHEVVVMDPLGFSSVDAAQLQRFARPVSDAVWKMDRKSVFGALENGDSEDEILSVLRLGSANEIPDSVIRLIHEVAERAGTVQLKEDAVAVEFADEQAAVLAANERAIAPTLMGRNGAVLFVRAKNLQKFKGGLRRMGMLLP